MEQNTAEEASLSQTVDSSSSALKMKSIDLVSPQAAPLIEPEAIRIRGGVHPRCRCSQSRA